MFGQFTYEFGTLLISIECSEEWTQSSTGDPIDDGVGRIHNVAVFCFPDIEFTIAVTSAS
ncbi:MAG: hypothetical protein HQ518_04850 [Rhodopirellula sp.]|nr:hypothetical protein [Rhodopirellula sp.]